MPQIDRRAPVIVGRRADESACSARPTPDRRSISSPTRPGSPTPTPARPIAPRPHRRGRRRGDRIVAAIPTPARCSRLLGIAPRQHRGVDGRRQQPAAPDRRVRDPHPERRLRRRARRRRGEHAHRWRARREPRRRAGAGSRATTPPCPLVIGDDDARHERIRDGAPPRSRRRWCTRCSKPRSAG